MEIHVEYASGYGTGGGRTADITVPNNTTLVWDRNQHTLMVQRPGGSNIMSLVGVRAYWTDEVEIVWNEPEAPKDKPARR